MLGNWQRFQTNLSQAYRLAGNAAFSQLDECYRLYTLAVAGAPANAAMNRLKESGKLEGRAEWMLAAAYAASGKTSQAKEIIAKGAASTGEYGAADFTYGSSLRDKAVVLQVLALSNDLAQAIPAAQEVAEYINKGYYSTQEAAFAAMAMDRLFAKVGTQAIKAQVGDKEVVSAKSVYSQPVSGRIAVKNTSDGLLYVTLTSVARDGSGGSPWTADFRHLQGCFRQGVEGHLHPAGDGVHGRGQGDQPDDGRLPLPGPQRTRPVRLGNPQRPAAHG